MNKIVIEIGGRQLTISTGELAEQAWGSALVSYGETVILATVVATPEASSSPYLPFLVDYRERTYAAGKIPGGFFKREGRPRDREILTSRLIDRAIRPFLKDSFWHDIQVMVTVLSSDIENDPVIPSLIGASAAMCLSPIPFPGPLGAVSVGIIDGELVINPTHEQQDQCGLFLTVAIADGHIIMMEGAGREASQEDVTRAIELAQKEAQRLINAQLELVQQAAKQKLPEEAPPYNSELLNSLKSEVAGRVEEILKNPDGLLRKRETAELKWELEKKYPDDAITIEKALDELTSKMLRDTILSGGRRLDNRKPDELRSISCRTGVLPRCHGSGLFKRGNTQALVTTTLGTQQDMQIMDELEGEYKKRFMLHYNFPPFSVGEVAPNRGPGRREIGHGTLAEKAIAPLLPPEEAFPYSIRVVSDILESNGSSSMATVCGGSLSLMDAGVAIPRHIAGVSVGLIKGDDRHVLLTDIAGEEDHYGDMDFKIAGTRNGITAIQLDVKCANIELDIIKKALYLACSKNKEIIDMMEKAIPEPREDVSRYAPRIIVIRIPVNKISKVIGPGGKTIKQIVSDTGAKIEVDQDGSIMIAAETEVAADKARNTIENLTAEAEVGKTYHGKVTRVTDFGAFVEIFPGTEGLVHVSQLSDGYVSKVADVVQVGDEIEVKCKEIDKLGRINLTAKKGHSNDGNERGSR